MEKTILICTILICLTGVGITTAFIQSAQRSSERMWTAIMQGVKEFFEAEEYKAFLKNSKDEKPEDSPEQPDDDYSVRERGVSKQSRS